jgi:hypothetical protein
MYLSVEEFPVMYLSVEEKSWKKVRENTGEE